MNGSDPSDIELSRGFKARIDAAPEPSAAMFARTLAGLAQAPEAPSASRWRSVQRWWLALATPARYAALAAAIVVGGGTLAFGTFRATHEPAGTAVRSTASRVSIDPRLLRPPQLAQTGSMRVTVDDVPRALRRIAALARSAHGSILSGDRAVPHNSSRALVVLRIPAGHLASTMGSIARLGTLRARDVQTRDLAAELSRIDDRLQHARQAGPSGSGGADIAGLLEERRRLAERIGHAFLAVTLDAANADHVALRFATDSTAEPSRAPARRTGTSLARGSAFASSDPDITGLGHRPFGADSSRVARARPSIG